jgi:hypothetical protein
MDNSVVIALVSWFFPGAGHLLQGRIRRGIIVGASIWLMFIIGVLSGGAHYPGFDFRDGALLYLLNIFAKLGSGLGTIVSMIVASQPAPHAAAEASFEYGGRLVETAGLLNYLAIMDAVDIHLGRKK